MSIKYDMDTDYQAEINKAVSAGDYASAKTYEQQRNAKIIGQGITDYQTTSNYQNYNPTPVQPQPPEQPQFDRQAQMEEMSNWNKQMAESNFQSQKAQLDAALEAEIAQLKMAYDQAVTDGQISVRDAEAQFAEQSKSIQQQAYQDSERTGLYGQDMGIQNSQQMIGLMQGDNARKNSLINQNITTRDKRVNDIRDRLTSIKTQKNIDMSRAQATHGYGVAGARASANQQMAQNMFGMMQDDYAANRDQSFTQDNMKLGDTIQRGQNEQLQGFNRENIETSFQNTIKTMTISHGFDLEKIDVSFNNQLTAMAKEHGYSKELEGIRQSGRMNEIRAQHDNALKMIDEQVKQQQAALARELDPNSNEYKIAEQNLKRERDSIASRIMSEQSATVWTEIVMGNPNLPAYGAEGKQEPHNYHEDIRQDLPSWLQPLGTAQGNVMNWFTGYDGKMDEYEKEQSALDMIKQYLGSAGIDPSPWTTDPKMSSFDRYLKGK